MKRANLTVVLKPNNLTEAQKVEMWNVYQKYYHYSKESFMERIPKNTHYSFYYDGNKLIGFTGLRINHLKVEGKKRLLMYFGQTVVEQAYRGNSLIQTTGFKLCLKYFKEILSRQAYFWADALTYRAYLVFAKTLENFYPARAEATPSSTQNLMDHIGNLHYGDTYDLTTGTIIKSEKFVNDMSVAINAKAMEDPDIAFYAQANPTSNEGNGLLVMAPVNWKNLKKIVGRAIDKQISAVFAAKSSKKIPKLSFK